MPPPVVRVPKYIGRGAFLDVPAYAGNDGKALVVGAGATGYQYVAVALAAHVHAGEDITSGTIADARIASTITRDNEVMAIVLAADGSGSGLDADLLRGVTPSVYGLTLIDDADAATARSTLGLGTIATATETNYLLAAGSRAGAISQAQAFTNGVVVPAGSVSAPGISFSGDTNTGIYSRADGVISFASNGTNKLEFDGTTLVFSTGGGFIGGGAATLLFGDSNDIVEFGATRVVLNNGKFGVQFGIPTALIHIASSTTSAAQLRFNHSGAADPTSPNDGDAWYNSRLKFRRSATTEIFATGAQATGGALTAAATYGSNEQSMLQKVYDAARAFGLLS